MELLIMIDACRHFGAADYGSDSLLWLCRQQTAGRESITALVANLITEAGATAFWRWMVTAQIQGYFDIPSIMFTASPVLLDYLANKQLPDIVVVSPMSAAWHGLGFKKSQMMHR